MPNDGTKHVFMRLDPGRQTPATENVALGPDVVVSWLSMYGPISSSWDLPHGDNGDEVHTIVCDRRIPALTCLLSSDYGLTAGDF